jgi:succinyl-diaminopimelate desuccinylase
MPSLPNASHQFADRYLRANEIAIKELPQRGTSGLEVEWNLLDSEMRPLETVGTGPEETSFVDALRSDFIPDWLVDRSQLEVFHWMIEFATRPYYSPTATVREARLLEALTINAMARAGRTHQERLYTFHGNLCFPVEVDHDSVPRGWSLAKRRYLQRCVDLFGPAMATAGYHANISLPEPLLSWDFIHQAPSERDGDHLDSYKNKVYIEATRLLRAFASLFIATGASTPLRGEMRDGKPIAVLTEYDSVRSLTFPNPETIDVPNLYRSYDDYVRISYDLVERGVRFGNNNWTPTRARSFAEPVERMIATTSSGLKELYRQGLYSLGEDNSLEEMAHQIEIQNLKARIDLPMARVEIRTDEGGHSMEMDAAFLAFKELLLILVYADPTYGRAFRYDAEDLARARRNEHIAAMQGLEAEIEDPFSGKPVGVRPFLSQTLDDLRPLAEALGRWELLTPLVEMANGAPNTAGRMRERIEKEIGSDKIVPMELIRQMAEEREAQVALDVEQIASEIRTLPPHAARLEDLFGRARDHARREPQAPIRFRPPMASPNESAYPDKTTEILALTRQLVRIPSITMAPPERRRKSEVFRAATLIFDYLRSAGLETRIFEDGDYPAVLAYFPGQLEAPVMLSGHFDVVEPEPDDTQFKTRIEGDYLWGRGSADMKAVVATYMVWMKDMLRRGAPYPAVNMLLIGNEEIGEAEPSGTPHVLAALKEESGYEPSLLIAGERTGENGDELLGQICVQNRGLVRLELIARGARGHSGVRGAHGDLSARLFKARYELNQLLKAGLTLESEDGWQSQLRFPYVQIGRPGIYNITAETGLLGIEIRPIPQDDAQALLQTIENYCQEAGLEYKIEASEDGIACDLDNPYLLMLSNAVRELAGEDPVLARKMPGTSARFAPRGQGVVWGQTGIGPHTGEERHFIPSILPYYQALTLLGDQTIKE